MRPPIASWSDLHHLLERGAVLPWHGTNHQRATDREVDVVPAGVRAPGVRRGRAGARGERVDRGGETPAYRRRAGSVPPIGAAEHAVPAAHAAPQRLAEYLAQIAIVAVLVRRAEVLIAWRVVERQRDLRVEVAELRVEDGVQEPRVHRE